ncbi:MAG: phosphorylase family protein, partial [Bdellovibrionales bacterium]
MRKLFCVFAFVISATTSFAAHCDDSSLRSDTLVVVGILREAELADGHGITVLISGADPVQLKEDLAAQDLTDVRAIFSFGLAGGLNPTYRTGDIVVPSAIIFGGQRWSTDRIIRENLIVQLRLKGMRVHESVLLGSNEIILTTRHKSDLHHFLRADAVDMESHVAAEFAA